MATRNEVRGDIADIGLADAGALKIEWADRQMPVLAGIRERFAAERPLEGWRISACLHVTAETANLMRTLAAGGADAVLCSSNPLSTQDDVAASLVAHHGIPTFAIKGEDRDSYYGHIGAALDHRPEVTMDDGADLVNELHTRRTELLDGVVGGTEETTTGVIRLRAMAKAGKLAYPIVAVNEALTKHLFDNRYGTGRAPSTASSCGARWRGAYTLRRQLSTRDGRTRPAPIRNDTAHSRGRAKEAHPWPAVPPSTLRRRAPSCASATAPTPITGWTPPGAADLATLPYTVKVLLENALRHAAVGDGLVSADDVRALAAWDPSASGEFELPFMPGRVILQDFTGVPCVVDLAAMRDAVAEMGGDPSRINPLVPADLVIDHSVQVDQYGSDAAFLINVEREYERNGERYALLRWAQQAFDNFRVVPPGTGIVHQVNLEFLADVVSARPAPTASWSPSRTRWSAPTRTRP